MRLFARHLLRFIQGWCRHNPADVRADICEGDWSTDEGNVNQVEWCIACGAYRIYAAGTPYYKRPRFRVPDPLWRR